MQPCGDVIGVAVGWTEEVVVLAVAVAFFPCWWSKQEGRKPRPGTQCSGGVGEAVTAWRALKARAILNMVRRMTAICREGRGRIFCDGRCYLKVAGARVDEIRENSRGEKEEDI